MTVAYILHTTDVSDGSTKAICTLIDGVSTYGVKPVVIVPDKEGIYQSFVDKGIPVFSVPFRPPVLSFIMNWKDIFLFLPRMVAKVFANPLAVRKASKFINDNQVDFIHSNVSVIDLGEKVARKLSIPHIYHIREYGDLIFRFYPSNEAYRKRLHQLEQYSICITHSLQEYFHLNKHKHSVVIYDGVMTQRGTMPKNPKKPYLLFVGRLEEQKGLDFLIEGYWAYHQQAKDPMPLVVAGAAKDTTVESRVKKYVKDRELEKSVQFKGHVSNVPELMQEATAIIISSSTEGFGFVMVEAMFNGCLCLGRNMSGTKEQMDNGLSLTGSEIAIRFDTEKQLAQWLAEVSETDSTVYDPFRQRAFETVNTLYSTEANVRQVYDFYQTIINETKEQT